MPFYPGPSGLQIENNGTLLSSVETLNFLNCTLSQSGNLVNILAPSLELVKSSLTISNFTQLTIGSGITLSDGATPPDIIQAVHGTTATAQLATAPAVGNYVLAIFVGRVDTLQPQPSGFVKLFQQQIAGGQNGLLAYGKIIASSDGNPTIDTAGSGANAFYLAEIGLTNGDAGASAEIPGSSSGQLAYSSSNPTEPSSIAVWGAFDTISAPSNITPAGTTFIIAVPFGSSYLLVFSSPIPTSDPVTLGYLATDVLAVGQTVLSPSSTGGSPTISV